MSGYIIRELRRRNPVQTEDLKPEAKKAVEKSENQQLRGNKRNQEKYSKEYIFLLLVKCICCNLARANNSAEPINVYVLIRIKRQTTQPNRFVVISLGCRNPAYGSFVDHGHDLAHAAAYW